MKKHITIFLLILSTTVMLAQKKEKIKGSKKVTTEKREIVPFTTLEIEDKLNELLNIKN